MLNIIFSLLFVFKHVVPLAICILLIFFIIIILSRSNTSLSAKSKKELSKAFFLITFQFIFVLTSLYISFILSLLTVFYFNSFFFALLFFFSCTSLQAIYGFFLSIDYIRSTIEKNDRHSVVGNAIIFFLSLTELLLVILTSMLVTGSLFFNYVAVDVILSYIACNNYYYCSFILKTTVWREEFMLTFFLSLIVLSYFLSKNETVYRADFFANRTFFYSIFFFIFYFYTLFLFLLFPFSIFISSIFFNSVRLKKKKLILIILYEYIKDFSCFLKEVQLALKKENLDRTSKIVLSAILYIFFFYIIAILTSLFLIVWSLPSSYVWVI